MRKHVKNFLQDPEAKFVCKRTNCGTETHTCTQIPSKPTNTELSIPNIPLIALSPHTHCVFVCRANTSSSFTSGGKKKSEISTFPCLWFGAKGPVRTSSGPRVCNV